MLAAGGVLGFLLTGAAIGGLMAGTEGPAPKTGNDDSGPDDLPGDDGQTDISSPGPLWTGDFHEDGSLKASGTADTSEAPLAQLLFGDAPTPEPESANATAAIPFETPTHVEVVETIPFPDSPDVPFVADFDCDTDRLVLDFEGTEDDAPEITIDLETFDGHAIVEANGIAVTLVENAFNLTAEHVETVMSGTPLAPALSDEDGQIDKVANTELFEDVDDAAGAAWAAGTDNNLFEAAPPDSAPLDDAGDGTWLGAPHAGDTATGRDGTFIIDADETDSTLLGTISDFDPEADQIEIIYDPDVIGDPTVEVVDFPDGSGADILLGGETVLHVVGAQGLAPEQIIVRSSAADPAPQSV